MSEDASTREGEKIGREAAEQALVSSRELLQSVINGTTDAVYVKDLAGRYLLFNHGAELTTGKSAQDVLGKDDTFLFPAEEARIVMDADREVIEGGVPRTYEEHVTAADGTLRHFLSTKGPIFDSEHQPSGLFGIARDITERKRMEEEIREREYKFRHLFDHSSVPMSLTVPDGPFEPNGALCEMLGYTREELSDQATWMSVSHPDDVAETGRQIEVLISGERAVARFEKRFIRKNGEMVWADLSSSLRRNAEGEPLYLMTTIIDITARRQAEDELRASEEKFRRMFEATPNAMTVQTREGVLLDCNDAFCDYAQRSREEVIGRTTLELGLWTNAGQRETMRDALAKDGRVDALEIGLQRPDGEVRAIQLTSRLLMLGSQPLVLAVADDITERKAAEDEVVRYRDHLEELVDARTRELSEANARLDVANEALHSTNAKLVKATATKDEFLACMSHELRTPLNSIIGFSGILIDGMAGEVNAEQKRQLEMVQGSGKRLLGLVNDILDLSKIEAGAVLVELAENDINEICSESLDYIRPEADRKGVALRFSPCPERCTRCGNALFDRPKLQQILLNLLGNAVKFTDTGEISLTIDCVGEAAVRVTVSDTGRGIAVESLERIFGEFERVKSGDAVETTGTGLGLPIARRLARLMGGDVTVTSTLEVGSQFTVELPLRFAEDAPQ
ncbi:MAG: hypothetical protein CVT67_04950 [Actinobacteria bacterium HGW-Actinobacteria-7]|jgi:two-component system sensor histidine kinase/response regulator|nr:MAG: hypothetical protein CVT67_04950 [Actinobacteria bacterium HGW-Actinobacteria-7]